MLNRTEKQNEWLRSVMGCLYPLLQSWLWELFVSFLIFKNDPWDLSTLLLYFPHLGLEDLSVL